MTGRITERRTVQARGWRLCLSAVTAFCLLRPAAAEIILGHFDWSTGLQGWASLKGWSQLTAPGSPQAWLNITFPETKEPEGGQDEWYDVAYVQATNLFAGTWSPAMSVRFDFMAEDVVPKAIQVQWKSSTNSSIWGSVLTPPATTNTWTRYGAGFGDWNDWKFAGASQDKYLSDLSSIEWIGVYVFRTGGGPQNYALDDFNLMIPEPPEIVMFASAVIASVAALRRRKSGHEPRRQNACNAVRS